VWHAALAPRHVIAEITNIIIGTTDTSPPTCIASDKASAVWFASVVFCCRRPRITLKKKTG